MEAHRKNRRQESRKVRVRKKMFQIYFQIFLPYWTIFFLVVGVLIWTIPANSVMREPPHWWGLYGKNFCDFVTTL